MSTSTNSLKVIFAGTPEFAAKHLVALKQSDHDVVAVYTQPDRPAGRGKKVLASPVKETALRYDLPVYQPKNLKEQADLDVMSALEADIMVVVAYGLLLPKAVLTMPRLGCINVHASLLPRWRGAAPIQRAIEAGDDQSGVTIMQMDEGLDTGDMLAKIYCDVLPTDTATDLHDRLATIGPRALIQTLDKLAQGDAQAEKQDDAQANYAHKLKKAEGLLDWSQPASVLHRRIRAFNPYPMAYFELNGDRVRVHEAAISASTQNATPGTIIDVSKDGLTVACKGESALLLKAIQMPGKKALNVASLLNGNAALFQVGQQLSV